jgi:hypothetical protein
MFGYLSEVNLMFSIEEEWILIHQTRKSSYRLRMVDNSLRIIFLWRSSEHEFSLIYKPFNLFRSHLYLSQIKTSPSREWAIFFQVFQKILSHIYSYDHTRAIFEVKNWLTCCIIMIFWSNYWDQYLSIHWIHYLPTGNVRRYFDIFESDRPILITSILLSKIQKCKDNYRSIRNSRHNQ